MPSTTYRTSTSHSTLSRFTGRGGAGNLTLVEPTREPATTFPRSPLAAVRSNSASSASPASSSASLASSTTPSDGGAAKAKAFASTGRGGSGNMARRSASDQAATSAAAKRAAAARQRAEQHVRERPMFSFDEELERQRRVLQHAAPVYCYFGRGGAGNRAPACSSSAADPPPAAGGASSVGAVPVRRASGSSVGSNQGLQDDGWSRRREPGTR